jgi:uridine kinase
MSPSTISEHAVPISQIFHFDPDNTAERPLGPPNTPASVAISPVVLPGESDDEINTFTPLDEYDDDLYKSLPQLTLCPELAKELPILCSNSDNVKAKAITIAISGPASGGKTTLAILLSEIFAFNSHAPAANDHVDQPKSQMLILHQDNYFLAKHHCPFVTFDSATTDTAFLEATLANDLVGQYIISWAGIRADYHPHIIPKATSPFVESEDPISDPGNSRIIASERELIDTRTPVWRITGPDTDCVAAIDFEELLKHVTHVKYTGMMPRQHYSFKIDEEETLNVDVHANVKDSQAEFLVKKYETLVQEMQGRVSKWAREQAIANAKAGFGGLNVRGVIEDSGNKGFDKRFCFVEGFLLYSDPIVYLGPKDITPANEAAKLQLVDAFDIKLFLPTAKEVAKRRRFERKVYIDQPEGTRVPGQMWKSEGYFEKVVWDNYVKEHAWILGDLDAEGIDIRPGTDFNVEGTVRWAVGVVLDELAKLEKAARDGMLQETE